MQKYLIWILGLVLLSSHLSPAYSQAQIQNTVNAVLGDISFVKKFGKLPNAQTPEKLRLTTHLNYVEHQLRSQIPDEIPKSLYPQREKLLNHLHEYIQAGVFPTQSAYQGRRPHFIDEQGRLCAVGYLVTKTAGLKMAQKINAKYRYEYLPRMNMPELNDWVKQSGLTIRELAMIQPAYGPTTQIPSPQDASPIQSALVGGGAILSILSGGMLLVHLLSFSLSPEVYFEFQVADWILTYSLMGLQLGYLLFLNMLASPSPYGNGFQRGISNLNTAGGVLLLFGLPIQTLLLYFLHVSHSDNQKSALNIKPLNLAQGTGLQATWHF